MAKHLLSARRVQTSGKGAYCDGAGLRLRVKAAGASWMNFRRKKHGNLKPKHWRGPQQPKRTPLENWRISGPRSVAGLFDRPWRCASRLAAANSLVDTGPPTPESFEETDFVLGNGGVGRRHRRRLLRCRPKVGCPDTSCNACLNTSGPTLAVT
jgi:hypothetical protein